MGKKSENILNLLLENGILDLSQDSLQSAMKKKALVEKHPFKIWEGADGNWYTYLPSTEPGKKRVLKRRTTQHALLDVVATYWENETENPTVQSVFDDWVASKLERDEITKATRDRYVRQFNESKDILNFSERRIQEIREFDIEEFVLRAIHDKSLTQKGFSNLRTIMYGIFKRSRKLGLISYNIRDVFDNIDISRKSFRKNSYDDADLLFSKSEEQRIFARIMAKNDPDLLDFGILLLFKTGMRPGELSALKREDISKNIIHVNRTEIHYVGDDGRVVYEVRDFPKTEAGIRDIIVCQSSMWILAKIRLLNPFGEYVFSLGGKRIKTYQFASRLKYLCRTLAIKQKSQNKIRKTYATSLIDGKVDESIIISQMGHTDIRTTKGYYYKDRHDVSEKERILSSVL